MYFGTQVAMTVFGKEANRSLGGGAGWRGLDGCGSDGVCFLLGLFNLFFYDTLCIRFFPQECLRF